MVVSNTMRRVSSRQRLVSWDAFDATAVSVSDFDSNKSPFSCNDEDEESYETARSSSLSLSISGEEICHDNTDIEINNNSSRRRKRDRKSFRSPVDQASTVQTSPSIIPSYSWEINKPSIKLNSLIDDLHIDIFSFLDLPSLRSIMSVNRQYRQLILSNDCMSSLWMEYCNKYWCFRRQETDYQYPQLLPPLKLIDNFNIPIAAPGSPLTISLGDSENNKTNLSLLLSLTPKVFPTCVDEDLIKIRMRYRHYEGKLIQFYQDAKTGHSLVRYIGPINQGDRCIRSNHPLPRPSSSMSSSDRSDSESISNNSIGGISAVLLGGNQHFDSYRPFLMNFLRRGSKSSCLSSPSISFDSNPFVVPFVDNCNSENNNTAVNVTPRFISYYEVSILKLDEDENDGTHNNTIDQLNSTSNNNRDCVAVGVATESFHVHSRMPGWDRQSFGYHGDDGGIFHSSGGMLKAYGPKFGLGDNVGCGIDYISKGIFYTLNGNFLGYAFTDIDNIILSNNLFPVVGLDTNHPIHLNFGTDDEAFQFNLSTFIMKHEEIVKSKFKCNEADSKRSGGDVISRSGLRRQKRMSFSGRRNYRDQKEEI